MVGRILLINPIGRRRKAKNPLAGRKRVGGKRTPTKRKKIMKRRTAAQRAATARLVALNKRRRNPIRKHRRRRNPISLAAAPRRSVRRRRRNPISVVRRHRRRRNPIAMKGLVNSMLMPALTASAGALLLDVAWAKLPIPGNLKSGSLQYVTKAIGAVGIAMVAEKTRVVDRTTAHALGVGALTVVLHDALRGVLKNVIPGLGLSEYVGGLGYYNAGWPAGTLDAPNTAAAPMVGEYVGDYMSGGADYDADNAYAGYYFGQR